MARPNCTQNYWPGGIPDYIRCHGHPIPYGELGEEIKGWQQFIEEKLEAGGGDGIKQDATALQKRRHLVAHWAKLSQAERDGYQDRAKARPQAEWFPPAAFATSDDRNGRPAPDWLNLVGVAQPLTPRDHALWLKMRILLYRLDGVDDGALIETAAAPAPNPEGGAAAPVTSETFLMWHYVENANFENMAMTRTGTVVFPRETGPCILVDQEALDTGKLLLCEFGIHGGLAANCRLRPWFMYEFWLLILALGKPVKEVLDTRKTWRFRPLNDPMDMSRPILEILGLSSMVMDGPCIGTEAWKQQIERYAPGYLAMEEAGQGMATNYDIANLRTRGELAGIPRG